MRNPLIRDAPLGKRLDFIALIEKFEWLCPQYTRSAYRNAVEVALKAVVDVWIETAAKLYTLKFELFRNQV